MKAFANYPISIFMSCVLLISGYTNGQVSDDQWMKTVSMDVAGFKENKGQVMTTDVRSSPDVLYIYSAKNFNLVLKAKGFSYELIQHKTPPSISEATGLASTEANVSTALNMDEVVTQLERFDATFIGASKDCHLIAANQLPGYANYYTSSETGPVTGVRSFKQITYQNLYPNIDLVFIAPAAYHEILRYQYIVHPGGNTNHIRIRYNTFHKVRVVNNALVIEGSFGFVNEERLFSYQENKSHEIPSTFKLNGNELSFQIKDYDRNNTLIIDPDIVWGTYYGDDFADDNAKEIEIDAEGNILVTGETATTANFTTEGAFQTTFGTGKFDAFIMKWSPEGNRIWVTYYGGNDRECGFGLKTDQQSNVYCTGDTRSAHLYLVNPHQPNFGGIVDVFILKLNKNGLAQWATYYGGADEDHNDGGIYLDNLANVYVCGWTESFENIATPGTHQPDKGMIMDAFLVKFNTDGIRLWSTYYGGDDEDRAHSLALDRDNSIYMSGTTPSLNNIATEGTSQPYCGGALDIFLVKFTTDGQRLWGTYYGGADNEHGREASMDEAGLFYITGYTTSETNISTPDAYQRNWATGYTSEGIKNPDACLAMYDANGILVYGTYLGGIGADYGRALKLEADGSVIIVGSTQSTGLGTNGVYQKLKSVGKDAFIAKFNSNGLLNWFTYVGGNGNDEGEEMAVDSNNNIYITGTTNSTIGIATPGAYEDTLLNNTVDDIMMLKFIDRCYDKYETNNSAKTATPLTVPENNFLQINAQIGVGGDKDFYSFANDASSPAIQIQLSNLPADYNLYLIGTNGKQVAKSILTGMTDEEINYQTIVVGTYKVKVQAANTSIFNDTVCYDLSISLIQPSLRTNENSVEVEDSSSQQFGFENPEIEDTFQVYPNPATTQVFLGFQENTVVVMGVQVFDMLGRLKYERFDLSYSSCVIDVSDWNEGMYLLMLRFDDKKFSQKLLISK